MIRLEKEAPLDGLFIQWMLWQMLLPVVVIEADASGPVANVVGGIVNEDFPRIWYRKRPRQRPKEVPYEIRG